MPIIAMDNSQDNSVYHDHQLNATLMTELQRGPLTDRLI